MKKTTCLASGIFCFLALLTVFGCATQPAPKQRVLYPAPPATPRVEWIATISSKNDFEKSASQKALEAITGEPTTDSLQGPIGIAATSKGIVLVSDLYAQAIRGIDFAQRDIFALTKEKFFRNNLGITVDRQDRIYVADGKHRKVMVFTAEGQPLSAIGGEDVFDKPAYLAINDDAQRLYVSDPLQHKVKVFALDGRFLFDFGGLGSDPGRFNALQGLTIDRDGQVYVADMLNARIQVFSADGAYLRNFGARGTLKSQFEAPKGVAFDSEGHLYVIDSRRPNFRIFNPDGQLLLEVGGGSRAETSKLALGLSTAIFIDANDRIYISDLMNMRVAVWQYLSPRYLKENPY